MFKNVYFFQFQHMFISSNIEEIVRKIQENATYFLYISIDLLSEEITLEEFASNRFGSYR